MTTNKPTPKPVKKAFKKTGPFGYGAPSEAKKAVASPTKTLSETLNKLDVPSAKKVK